MNHCELELLLGKGEGATLEFKESLPGSFARELVALANSEGGIILLGVRDNGTVKGIDDSNALRARIQDIARNCDPPVQLLLQRVGRVTAVHVHQSAVKPVQCSDGFFWRNGAVTQKLSRDEIRNFFRGEGAVRFDLSPCARFQYPKDFDREKYQAWIGMSGIRGRTRAKEVLVNIEAAELVKGKLRFRNAGVLFFAREPRRFFNQRMSLACCSRALTKWMCWIARISLAALSVTFRKVCDSLNATRAWPTELRSFGARRFRSIHWPRCVRQLPMRSCIMIGSTRARMFLLRFSPTEL